MRRSGFAVDVFACARCGGRLRLIATLDASETTRRIRAGHALHTKLASQLLAEPDAFAVVENIGR